MHHSAKITGLFLLGIMPLFFAGCMPRHSDAVAFGTYTVVGVKVGVDQNHIPTIDVGYNRAEGVYLPLMAYGDELDKTGPSSPPTSGTPGKDGQAAGAAGASLPPPTRPGPYTAPAMFASDPAGNAAALEAAILQLKAAVNYLQPADGSANLTAANVTLESAKIDLNQIDANNVTSPMLKKLIADVQKTQIPATPPLSSADAASVASSLATTYNIMRNLLFEVPPPGVLVSPDLMYKGVHWKNGDSEYSTDMYSVLATINAGLQSNAGYTGTMPAVTPSKGAPVAVGSNTTGNATVSGGNGTTSAQVNGNLAQFFATGMAAQYLSQVGGAALFNPMAPTTADSNAKQAQANATTALANAATVKTLVDASLDKQASFMKKINSLTNPSDRQTYAQKVLPKTYQNFPSASWSDVNAIWNQLIDYGGPELATKSTTDLQ